MRKVKKYLLIILFLEILIGLLIFIKSEIEYIKIYVPEINNLMVDYGNVATTIYGKDNLIMYQKCYKLHERLPESYDILELEDIINIFLKDKYENREPKNIPFWKRAIFNYQKIDITSIKSVAYDYYSNILISKTTLSGFKRELLFWYTKNRLHKKYNESEITRLFLDNIKYNDKVFGIYSAGKYYFNKDIKDLNLLEKVFLVSFINTSGRVLDIKKDYQEINRQVINLLNKLNKENIISNRELLHYASEKIEISKNEIETIDPSYIHQVFKEMDNIPKIKENEGIKNIEIYTGYDEEVNSVARQVLSDYFKNKDSKIQAAFVLVNNKTGEIVSAIGSRAYNTNVNRAFSVSRPMASTFKSIVFLAAFEKGFSPNYQIVDKPYAFGNYHPRNFDGYFMGKIPMNYAFIYSLNNATIKLAEKVGLKYICNLSKEMGMTNNVRPYYSMALGAFPATPITVAQIYSTIGSLGEYRKVRLISSYKIDDEFVDLKDVGKRVVSVEAASKTLYYMKQVASRGTARSAGLLPGTGAKTGTSNYVRDAWIATIFDDYTAVVWVGYDDGRSIKYGDSAGKIAAPIIAKFQRKFYGK